MLAAFCQIKCYTVVVVLFIFLGVFGCDIRTVGSGYFLFVIMSVVSLTPHSIRVPLTKIVSWREFNFWFVKLLFEWNFYFYNLIWSGQTQNFGKHEIFHFMFSWVALLPSRSHNSIFFIIIIFVLFLE